MSFTGVKKFESISFGILHTGFLERQWILNCVCIQHGNTEFRAQVRINFVSKTKCHGDKILTENEDTVCCCFLKHKRLQSLFSKLFGKHPAMLAVMYHMKSRQLPICKSADWRLDTLFRQKEYFADIKYYRILSLALLTLVTVIDRKTFNKKN